MTKVWLADRRYLSSLSHGRRIVLVAATAALAPRHPVQVVIKRPPATTSSCRTWYLPGTFEKSLAVHQDWVCEDAWPVPWAKKNGDERTSITSNCILESTSVWRDLSKP